jgi:Flp pilus assembly protein TadB
MLGSLYSWISPHIETKNSYTQTWFKEEPEQIKFLDENQVSAIRSKEARPSLRCCGVGCGACLATGFGAARDVSLGAAFAFAAFVFAAVFLFEAWGMCCRFSAFLSKLVEDLDLLTWINFTGVLAGALAASN